MIVRELVTLLKFKTEGQGQLSKFAKAGNAMQAKLKPMQAHLAMLEKIDRMRGMRAKAESLRNPASASVPTNVTPSFNDAVKVKMRQMQSYRQDLKSLSIQERKDTLELNMLEKNAERQVRAEQKVTERERDNARKRQIAHIRNTTAGMQRMSRVATRVSVGLASVASASFISAYKEYKKYTESLKKGQVIKTSLTPDMLKKFGQFDKVFSKSKGNVLEFRNAIASQLIPEITALLNNLNNWYSQNKDIVNSQFITWLKRALYAVTALKLATTGMQIAQAFSIITASVKALGGVTAVATLGMTGLRTAMFSFAIPLAVVAGLLNDLWVAFKGGDSVTGDLINYFKNLDNVLAPIIEKMKQIKDFLLTKFQQVKAVLKGETQGNITPTQASTANRTYELAGMQRIGESVLNQSTTNNNKISNNSKAENKISVNVSGITINTSGANNRAEIDQSLKDFALTIGNEMERKITANIEAKQQADLALTLNNFGR